MNIHCALGPASLPAFCHVLLLILFARVVFHALPCYGHSVICILTELWIPVTYYHAVSSSHVPFDTISDSLSGSRQV